MLVSFIFSLIIFRNIFCFFWDALHRTRSLLEDVLFNEYVYVLYTNNIIHITHNTYKIHGIA